MANDHHRAAVQPRQSADDGMVVAVVAVAVQFAVVGEGFFDVVQGVGALRVPRQLGNLPVVEAGEDAFGQGFGLVLQAGDFVAEIDFGLAAELAQFGEFVF